MLCSARFRFVSLAVAAGLTGLLMAGTSAAMPLGAPAASCTSSPYAYAGLADNNPAGGVKAVITPLADAQVPNGHVAGWIGVGGANAGPGGQAEWIQAGIATVAGGSTEVYAEITQPGLAPRYQTLRTNVNAGASYRLAVLEVPGSQNVWQVWLDGVPVTNPVLLPGSANFAPMVVSESWNGGTPTCNGFAYGFGNVQVSPKAGKWSRLGDATSFSDNGYRIVDRSLTGFSAISG
ncbi:MAG TPA: hypothetical protein VGM80_06155 [Gaiellaceae bacterium]|jgi:hypothetical protein